MTSEKPEWFELSEGDESAPVLRKKSKKLPFIAVAAAGAIVLGGALFANANDEPNANASTSSMTIPGAPSTSTSTGASTTSPATPGAPTISTVPQGNAGQGGQDGFGRDGDHHDGDHRDGERHDD
jgi:hypothetical protein